jgi:hypothetical protein
MTTLVEVSPPHGGVPGVGPHGTMGSGGGVELLVPKHTAARTHTKWRRIDAAGDNSAMQADKHTIAQRCAVPLRDLRLLDADLTTRHVLALLFRQCLSSGCALFSHRAQLLHRAACSRAGDDYQPGTREGAS